MNAPHDAASPQACQPPQRWVEPADLVQHADWLPPSAHSLVRVAGTDAALALMQRCPGVQFVVPRHRDANAAGAARWQALAEVVGEAAMPAITAHYAPGVLDVPTCRELLTHKRNTWIRQRFDGLTSLHGAALSAYAAVQEINLALAQAGWPLTLREVQKVVNAAASASSAAAQQQTLPGIPPPLVP